jgi:hypothetical protein
MDREEDGQGGASGKRARDKGARDKGTSDAGATEEAKGQDGGRQRNAAQGRYLCVAACLSSFFSFFVCVHAVEGKRGAKLDTEQKCLRSAVCEGEGAFVFSMSWGSHSISD